MNMRRTLVTALALALAGAPLPAAAQAVSLEIRGSLLKATGEFSDPGGIEAVGDAGFGADILFNLSPRFSLYGGYARDGFGCEGCDDDDLINAGGFEGGVKLLLGSGTSATPWLRAGAVYQTLRVERGAMDSESDPGLGFQAGFGVDLPLGQVLSFSPAIRYQVWQAEFDVLGDYLVAQEDVSYLALDLGVHIHPGR